MNIQPYHPNHLTQMESLWTTFVQEKNTMYQPMSRDIFVHSFVPRQTEEYDVIAFVALQSKIVIGWMSGVYHKKSNNGYLTMILVDEPHRQAGIGRQLVAHFETSLQHIEPSILSIDVVFFNPVHLSWTIPHPTMNHPNMPGVVEGSIGEQVLKACGYHKYAVQQAYGKQLTNNEMSPTLLAKRQALARQGIEIVWYDSVRHEGFAGLFENLNSPHWFRDVTNALNQGGPLLVVVQDNVVMGFAGPLFVSPTNRGVFSGIGVHSDCRGLGVGQVLFACLCEELHQLGATYMTLFTGEHNPAKRIYERQGFVGTNRFVNLRKPINYEK